MPQTSFKSIASVAVLLIVACFGLAYFVTTQQWTKHKQEQAKLTSLQADNQKLTDALASIKNFLTSYDSNKKSTADVSLALPVRSADLANFTSSVGDLAKSAGVVLSNITINDSNAGAAPKTAPDNSIQVVPITLLASGSYASFKDFMIRLEEHLRLVDISHVAMKSNDNGLIQYDINLQTYFQK